MAIQPDPNGNASAKPNDGKKKKKKGTEGKNKIKATDEEQLGEDQPNIKDLYAALQHTLLLTQAANIRLGLSTIPLPGGTPDGGPKSPPKCPEKIKPEEVKMDDTITNECMA